MRIAVNCRFLLPHRLEGLGRYTWEVLVRMLQQQPHHEWHLVFDRRRATEYYRPLLASLPFRANITLHTAFPQARHPLLYLWYFEHTLPRLLADLRPDVYFSPDGYLCLNLSEHVPQIGVIHDLAFEHFPQDVDRLHRWHYQTFFPQYARRAAVQLTVSNSTRQDIHTRYGVPLHRIRVTHCGASGNIRPLPVAEQQAVRQAFSHGYPYFLHVGAIQPRKNLDVLLRAFDAYKTASGSATRLLIVGRYGWRFQAVQQAYDTLRHQADVVFTGWVSDADLARLYASARALVYPSRFEGFGLPVLEAFHAEVPVITTNASSLPEVAGNAALLVPPGHVPELAQALHRLDTDDTLRSQLVQAGCHQRMHFSWERAAQTVWQALHDAAHPLAG
jgi:glycosyltransferase involved in cell wall biosynthesis